MEPTVRKQITLTRAQAQALKERARREHLSEADLLRRAVERLLDAEPSPEAVEDFNAMADRIAAAFPSEPGSSRDWTRDSLYDERLARFL